MTTLVMTPRAKASLAPSTEGYNTKNISKVRIKHCVGTMIVHTSHVARVRHVANNSLRINSVFHKH